LIIFRTINGHAGLLGLALRGRPEFQKRADARYRIQKISTTVSRNRYPEPG
jgi:hypothetical protein